MKRFSSRRSILIIFTIVLAMLARAAPALAHAIVTRTDPVDGTVLSTAPRQVRLWFSEQVALNLSKFVVTDSHGQQVLVTSVQADAADPALVIIDLPDLKPDAYRVAWDALSTDDLHITSGSIVFGVQTAADSASIAQPDTAPQPFEVIVRWIDFAALATMIGALALALLTPPMAVLPPADAGTPLTASTAHRLLSLALAAAGAALFTSFGGVIVQAITIGGSGSNVSVVDAALQLLTQTAYGSRWLMREGWTMALLFIIVWQRRQPQVSRLVLGATMPLVFALVVLQAMNGHATAFNDTSLVRIAADALHLLGAGLWVGSLIALAVAIVPLLRRGPDESALARSILRRFGLLAASSLSLLLVTGLYNSGQQIASLDALLFTLYGQSLLLKIGLILGAGLIGLINSSLLHPRVADPIRRLLRRPAGWTLVAPRHLWRTVTIEAIGASGVLLFAALLGSSQPARGPEFDPPPAEEAAPTTTSSNVADLFVSFSIKPNRPGQNFISIGAFDTRRPAPAPIQGVSVRLTTPDGENGADLNADLISKGKYQITGNAITAPGDWQVMVDVQRPGLADAVWSFVWNVMPASRLSPRAVVISNQPLEPILDLIAVIAAVVLGGALIVVGRRAWATR
jgi:copper transport protein